MKSNVIDCLVSSIFWFYLCWQLLQFSYFSLSWQCVPASDGALLSILTVALFFQKYLYIVSHIEFFVLNKVSVIFAQGAKIHYTCKAY